MKCKNILYLLNLIISIKFIIGTNTIRGPSEITNTKTSELPKEKLVKPDVGEIWSDLFTVPRTSTCKAEENKKRIIAQIRAEKDAKLNGNTLVINDSSFYWVKNWGFGPVAYLFDFWDPLFKQEIVEEFKSIHNATMHESPENTPEYSDPFDHAGKLSNSPPERQNALMKDLKRFERNYDPIIFKNSANAVQIYKAFKSFNWFIDPGQTDFATDFVSKYDINHDGRLNPKELILGSIDHNKRTLGSKRCNHCYTQVFKKLSALFTYLDCGETGFVNAEKLWKGLPELRRPTNQYNIFGYKSNENIRTSAINDFVLKNHLAKDAFLNKEEFISGILFGVWERQVTESAIIEDDSRNLKRLRWTSNNMIDIQANNYVIASTKAKLEQEERERYEKWERQKLNEANKAKELLRNGI